MPVTVDPISFMRALAAGVPTHANGLPLTFRVILVPPTRNGAVLDSRRLLVSDLQTPSWTGENLGPLLRRNAGEPSIVLLQPNPLIDGGRGDADTPYVSCVWVDVDGKALPIAQSYARLESLSKRVRVAAVVRSGSLIDGWPKLHAFFRVRPLVTAAEALPVWRRVAAFLGGDSACVTPSHAVAVPASMNWKSGSPVFREGLVDPDGACSLLDLVQALDAVGAPMPEPPAPRPRPQLTVQHFREGVAPGRVAEILSRITDGDIRAVLAAGWSPSFASRWPSNSQADLAAGRALLVAGATLEEADEIWLSSTLGAREKVQSRADYRASTLNRAAASVPEISTIEITSVTTTAFTQRADLRAKVISGPFAGAKFTAGITLSTAVWARAFVAAQLQVGQGLEDARALRGRVCCVALRRDGHWLQVKTWLSGRVGSAAGSCSLSFEPRGE